ncbi:heat-inducible transcription repressor [Ketogulonicigenium robustum]|uniref:Heat-inducible transcription repressor HrcA n=1 Tax=Ketogulonicigenium robustum TaxID=92947 RepID=A0A1W6P312_9RHOB|nr:heat-inducible transcriptional repressor HrcA [Ketogulonicigenium robustum]ARO15687.1 heat-inducible transcription repressor [Ketogulonicigenium robustum]
MNDKPLPLEEMNTRSREVFRLVVESYLDTGAPVGSRTLTRAMSEKVSAATVRNVMQDLEYMGLLGSPHISAGRVPTQAGLRLFVDGLMEVSDLTGDDRQKLDATLTGDGDVTSALDRVSAALSGVTRGASVVLTPKTETAAIRQIDFVSLSPERALVVLVFTDGHVENRLFTPPAGLTPSAMREAANMLNATVGGKTLADLAAGVATEIDARRREIDTLASTLVQAGLAAWVQEPGEKTGRLIVRGAGNLLADSDAAVDLERIRTLFDDLERKSDIAEFLDLARTGEGVRIFIGSENKLFSLTGSSLVLSPYMNADRKIVGAIGVIGPTRLNYGRIIPIVDYTAQLIGKLIAERS